MVKPPDPLDLNYSYCLPTVASDPLGVLAPVLPQSEVLDCSVPEHVSGTEQIQISHLRKNTKFIHLVLRQDHVLD